MATAVMPMAGEQKEIDLLGMQPKDQLDLAEDEAMRSEGEESEEDEDSRSGSDSDDDEDSSSSGGSSHDGSDNDEEEDTEEEDSDEDSDDDDDEEDEQEAQEEEAFFDANHNEPLYNDVHDNINEPKRHEEDHDEDEEDDFFENVDEFSPFNSDYADDDDDDDASQCTSLLDSGKPKEEEVIVRRRSKRSWRNLLSWRRSASTGSSAEEDKSLLATCTEAEDDELAESANSSGSKFRMSSAGTRSFTSFDESDGDDDHHADNAEEDGDSHDRHFKDDDDDDDDDSYTYEARGSVGEQPLPSSSSSRRSLWGRSRSSRQNNSSHSKSASKMRFFGFSSRSRNRGDTEQSSLLESSETVLHFSDEAMEENTKLFDSSHHSDEGSVSSSTSISETQLQAMEGTASPMGSRSMHTSHSRMEGFGNSVPDEMCSPRTLRERLKLYKDKRMNKMQIGAYDDDMSRSWTQNLETKVIDLVDSVLPTSTETDGRRKEATTMRFSSRDTAVQGHSVRIDPDRTLEAYMGKRKEIADDEGYITYLQCELQNRDLEINALRTRLAQLESSQLVSDADDDSVDDNIKSEGAYTLFDDEDSDSDQASFGGDYGAVGGNQIGSGDDDEEKADGLDNAVTEGQLIDIAQHNTSDDHGVATGDLLQVN